MLRRNAGRGLATLAAAIAVAGTVFISIAPAAADTATHSAASVSTKVVNFAALTSTSLVSATDQAAAEETVAAFVAAHPEPTYTMGGSAAAFAAYDTTLEAYWKTVPWEAVYAQWGCVLKAPATVTETTDANGVAHAHVTVISNCGGSDIANTLVGSVQTKTAFVSTDSNLAALRASIRGKVFTAGH